MNLGAPVLLAVRGFGRTPAEILQLVKVCESELHGENAHLMAVIANRCDPEQLDEVDAALATLDVPSWALPEVPLLSAPTMAELLRGGRRHRSMPAIRNCCTARHCG